MKRETELELIDELLGLKDAGSAFLDETVAASPVARYACPERFEHERRHVFGALPLIAAHASELPRPNTFVRRELTGLPVLFTRDDDNAVHAFLNVCRHRGARLVDQGSGCARSFSCPYHAWTWNNRGELRGIPHERQGFPGLDKADWGLRRLPCEERLGWIWVTPDPDGDLDLDTHLGEIADDLEWLDLAGHAIAVSDEIDCAANWKLLVEGGIEAYHFRVAHKDTIAPYFLDNLSSYHMFGRHIRSVLPRSTLSEYGDQRREDWAIRDHIHLLYSVFPTSQLLVQHDHLAWVRYEPKAADRTLIRLSTVAPAGDNRADHWQKNHDITLTTLREDFALGESIQSGFASGANEDLRFGRYEGALHRFNGVVEEMLAAM